MLSYFVFASAVAQDIEEWSSVLKDYDPNAAQRNQFDLDDEGFIIETQSEPPLEQGSASRTPPSVDRSTIERLPPTSESRPGVVIPQTQLAPPAGLFDGSGNRDQPSPYEGSSGRSVIQPNQQGSDWSIESVLNELPGVDPQAIVKEDIWWTPHVAQPVNSAARPVYVNMGDLILMAMEHSARVSVARTLPQIRETAIVGAASEFDWNQFIDARFNDVSEPVGSSLTVGLGGTRFREHDFSIDTGFRRKFFNGADFYTYQRAGHVNSNSSFFIPNNQATSRIVLGFTQPLLRGRGAAYNTSLILLAEIDAGSANDEFHRQLQAHLLEVARGYWALYLERATLAQKVALFLKTREITDQLNSRSNIDAQRSQVISANAALASRRADLIRSQAAVKNAETRLRALINSPLLEGDSNLLEIIPAEHPTDWHYPVDSNSEFQIAVQNRPEVAAALKNIHAASVRLDMSDHEILPTLNLVTEAYVAGLQGDSDFGNAWLDQFREGEPGYSIGLQYEVPLGRRAATSNQRRRQLEVFQLQEQYRATLELVRAEVEVAVREMQTAYRELHAKNRSRYAVAAEVKTLEARWNELGDQGSTGGLLLESLLRAQERLNQFEYEFAKSQLTYSLALINLRHANGTLYRTEGVGDNQVQPASYEGQTPSAGQVYPIQPPVYHENHQPQQYQPQEYQPQQYQPQPQEYQPAVPSSQGIPALQNQHFQPTQPNPGRTWDPRQIPGGEPIIQNQSRDEGYPIDGISPSNTGLANANRNWNRPTDYSGAWQQLQQDPRLINRSHSTATPPSSNGYHQVAQAAQSTPQQTPPSSATMDRVPKYHARMPAQQQVAERPAGQPFRRNVAPAHQQQIPAARPPVSVANQPPYQQYRR